MWKRVRRAIHRVWAHVIMSDAVARDIQDHLSGGGTDMDRMKRMQRIGGSRWAQRPSAIYWSHPMVRGR